jgi:hypothetical protein
MVGQDKLLVSSIAVAVIHDAERVNLKESS